MNSDCKEFRTSKWKKSMTLGALALVAIFIIPTLSASAHEWEHKRQGPPYGWAKGHDKWKDKDKHHDHEHEWEHRRSPYWTHRPANRRYGTYYPPYYYRPRPNVTYRPRPYDYRYPRDRWQQESKKSTTDFGKARDQVTQGRQQLRQQKEELRKDRAELRRDIRNHASKEEIRQDRQEIRQDRQNIDDTRKELRWDRATLR